jgi:hypothetical protein
MWASNRSRVVRKRNTSPPGYAIGAMVSVGPTLYRHGTILAGYRIPFANIAIVK